MRALVLFCLFFGALSAVQAQQRIIGGSLTTIDNYPSLAALLQGEDFVNFRQVCGGAIINQRSVLTAAHCFTYNHPGQYRVRLGSTFANSGGIVYNLARLIPHPTYSIWTIDSDIAVVQTTTAIVYTDVIYRADLAGPNYVVPDNAPVMAAGWGATDTAGTSWSEQLRHVQLNYINLDVCRQQWDWIFSNNMICAGVPSGGQASCPGDSGGPLIHNGVIVGVTSVGSSICGNPNLHAIYAKVSTLISWVEQNA